jgi:1,4-dihydroxy-2-naphthoyl-CoA hydrolase
MQPLDAEQLARLAAMHDGTLSGLLGMEFVEVSGERVVVRMPVTDRAKQPLGILHGGATVALCETAASIGTYLSIDHDHFNAVGLEINCNHLRPTRDGTLTATATPVHRGRTTWVWDIRVLNDANKLVAISRCTVAVVPKQG